MTDAAGVTRPKAGPNAEIHTDDGLSAVLQTSAGPIEIRPVGQASAPSAAATARGVSSTGALGGRDLRYEFTATGVEESVVVPTAKDSGSYEVEMTLPAGVTAWQRNGGVVLSDKTAEVATYGDAAAVDSATSPSTGPVTVTLVGQNAGTAVVSVTVDAKWLADPARVFPVTIDPSAAPTTTGGFDGQSSGTGNITNSFGSQILYIGGYGPETDTRSWFVFPTS